MVSTFWDIESSESRTNESGDHRPGTLALDLGLRTWPDRLLIALQNRPIRGVLHSKAGRLDVCPEAVCRLEVAILSSCHPLPEPLDRPPHLLHFLRAKSFGSNRFRIDTVGRHDKPQRSWLQVQNIHDRPEHLTPALQHRDISPLTVELGIGPADKRE